MKLSPFFQFLLLVLVTLGAYYPTLFAPYNSLDDKALVSLLLNQQEFSLARHFSPGGVDDYYRPLLSLTFEIDKYVGGLQETFMHLVNVLVHLLNVIMVWLIARRFGDFIQRPSEWLPLFAALIFALHPINTEAVNWIAGRTDLLAGTFVFLSLYALLKFIDRRSLLWGVAGATALLGGALCKETALFFIPGACFLLFCRTEHDRPVWPLRWVLPALYGVAVTTYFTLRCGAFGVDRGLSNTVKLAGQAFGFAAPVGGGTQTAVIDPFPWLDAVRVVLKASGFYATKLFQPMPLNFAIYRLDAFFVVPGVVLIVALVVFVCRRRLVGWLFLVSASIAVSALMVLFTQLAWTPIAERYMYIPCGPFVIGLVYAIGTWCRVTARQNVALIVMPLLLGLGAWSTVSRNIVWQDNLTLYQDTVRKSPDFAPAKNQLAIALIEHGQKSKALVILDENRINEGDSAALNKAAAYWENGDFLAAREELLTRLQSSRTLEREILEMLVKITSEQAVKIDDERLKHIYYEDILAWLERIRTRSPSGFISYRIGRVQLLLENKVAAQKAFDDAARRFPQDSIYKEPATKLARDLAQ